MFENARVLVKSCVWNHNTSIGGGGYGQNLAAGYANLDIGKAITGGWYEGEVGKYVVFPCVGRIEAVWG